MSPLTEQSRPQYASPSPVKMKLFQQPVPGTKTPSFIPPPSKKLENGLNPRKGPAIWPRPAGAFGPDTPQSLPPK